MIAEQYINEGIRLRKEYLQNLKEILKQESKINEKKVSFQKIKDEMENIVNSDLNDVRKTLELNNRLILLEKELKFIQDIIRPFYDNIENGKKERDRLYLAIKEKYPSITTEEIEKDIMSKIKE
jgi:hypothetical protein